MAIKSSSNRGIDPLRPADHVDAVDHADGVESVTQPRLRVLGWLRFGWRQLTSMRTAILLLLLLAIAAVPGSLVPQRSSDPNGVAQYFREHADIAPLLDKFQLFDVYTSVWFSAVYLLLFVSLIGCIIPRTSHHLSALRSRPPRTPAHLKKLVGYTELVFPPSSAGGLVEGVRSTEPELIDRATLLLRKQRYRVERYEINGVSSVSAERGYLRETGNLIFHTAMLGVLAAVAIGGGFGFSGQRVVVTGQSFVNTLAAYDSFSPGRFFNDSQLDPFRLTLGEFAAQYETQNTNALGQPVDFTAQVTVSDQQGKQTQARVKVNEPLRTHGTDIYLLGNGYAPSITVRDPQGRVVFSDSIPFLPQDANLTSIGVVKVPDGLPKQLGMVGFFYPTASKMKTGAYTSSYPDLIYPMLTLNVYEGDLGINDGKPTSVYALDTSTMTQLTGGETGVDSIELQPGQSRELPGGRGTITFESAGAGRLDNTKATVSTSEAGQYANSVRRFASFDIHHDPSQGWVLAFAILIVAGLGLSLFIPRRRLWVKAVNRDGTIVLELAGLARGEDPGLVSAVGALADKLKVSPTTNET